MNTDTKKVGLDQIQEQVGTLFSEIADSGLDIDAFAQQKLSQMRKGMGVKCANDLSKALDDIDVNYESLRKEKSNGGDRHDWLVDKINQVIREQGAENKRDLVGKVFALVCDAINGKEPGTTEAHPFSGLDASTIIAAIEEKLYSNGFGLIR